MNKWWKINFCHGSCQYILLEVSWPNFMSANGWRVVNSNLCGMIFKFKMTHIFLSYQQRNLGFQVKCRNETGVVRIECFTVQRRRDKFKFQAHVDHFSVVVRLYVINLSPTGQTVDLHYQISQFIWRSSPDKWGYEIGGFIMTITPPYQSNSSWSRTKQLWYSTSLLSTLCFPQIHVSKDETEAHI
jgi:hypothetical protein